VQRTYAGTRQGELLGPKWRDADLAAATALRSGNIDLKTVSERLGHSNIGTTASIYTHGVPEADIEAARMLQDLIRSTRRDGGTGHG